MLVRGEDWETAAASSWVSLPSPDQQMTAVMTGPIYHVSIMYLSWRWYTPAGAGAAPLTLLQPRPDLTTSEVHSILLHWLQVAVRRCYEIHKYLLRKIVSIYIYTAKSEVKSGWNIILLWIWSCCVYVNIFGDSQIDLSNYTINTFQQPKLILQFDGQIRSRSWQKVKIPG